MSCCRITIVICLLFVFGAQAQTDSVYYGREGGSAKALKKKLSDQPWADKVSFGINAQVWLGTRTFVILSPNIGYWPAENINIGIGAIYNYASVNYGRFGKISQTVWGGHSYARYIIAQNYFVQGQFDMLRQPDWYSPVDGDKAWVEYMLVGGGFRQPLGDRAALISSIMYNLTPHPLSIYGTGRGSRLIFQLGFVSTL